MERPLWRQHEDLARALWDQHGRRQALPLDDAASLERLERRLLTQWLLLGRDAGAVLPDDASTSAHFLRCAATWVSQQRPAMEDVVSALSEDAQHPWRWLLIHLPPEPLGPWLTTLGSVPTLRPLCWEIARCQNTVPAGLPEPSPNDDPDTVLARLRWMADHPRAPVIEPNTPGCHARAAARYWWVRGACARGRISAREGLQHLQDMESSDAVLRLMGVLGLSEALETLVDALPRHAGAAWGLALNGTPAAVDALIAGLAQPRHLSDIHAALEAVSGLRLPRGPRGPRPLRGNAGPDPQMMAQAWWRKTRPRLHTRQRLWQGAPQTPVSLARHVMATAGREADGLQLRLALALGAPPAAPREHWQYRRRRQLAGRIQALQAESPREAVHA
ncbi:MAG: hypothetical protein EA372_09395 [Chromatiaceae bacterium]|nr:MAG: hypothetical protein EA372_09395 [Chromatiaceae bacterium]